jgi:TolQ protein
MQVMSTIRGSSWLRVAVALGLCVFALSAVTPVQAQQPQGGEAPAATAPATGAPGAELAPGEEDRKLAQDLSIWSMFMDAGSVAKSVMIMLVLASVWNLMIFFEKSYVLRRVNRQADRFLNAFRKASSLEDLGRGQAAGTGGPMARMFSAGMQEFHLSADHGIAMHGEMRERVRERIGGTMGIVQSHETRTLGTSMSVLATIGSTAPFIGLFGTVWGIMTSFIGIAQTQTTNLAVVAPGIAEALLATAIGLAAAIPAVMLYNKFSRDIGSFSGRLEDFASEFSVVLSRELDRREVA